MSEAQPGASNLNIASDLTAFQRNILTILAEEDRYGLAIKQELEEYYGSEVNHGRLYTNLNDLVEMGLVEKSELDKRTNQYALTDEGEETLLSQWRWELAKFMIDDNRAGAIEDLLDEHLKTGEAPREDSRYVYVLALLKSSPSLISRNCRGSRAPLSGASISPAGIPIRREIMNRA